MAEIEHQDYREDLLPSEYMTNTRNGFHFIPDQIRLDSDQIDINPKQNRRSQLTSDYGDPDNDSLYDNSEYGVKIGTWKDSNATFEGMLDH